MDSIWRDDTITDSPICQSRGFQLLEILRDEKGRPEASAACNLKVQNGCGDIGLGRIENSVEWVVW